MGAKNDGSGYAREENARLRARCDELEDLFRLQETRMSEAVEMYRAETGENCLPDLGKLLKWLLAEIAALKAIVNDWKGIIAAHQPAPNSASLNSITEVARYETEAAGLLEEQNRAAEAGEKF